MLPLAHVGHYLWVLYLLPVVIVIGGIVRSHLVAKRQHPPPEPPRPPEVPEGKDDPPAGAG